jgi:hypothetical protein
MSRLVMSYSYIPRIQGTCLRHAKFQIEGQDLCLPPICCDRPSTSYIIRMYHNPKQKYKYVYLYIYYHNRLAVDVGTRYHNKLPPLASAEYVNKPGHLGVSNEAKNEHRNENLRRLQGDQVCLHTPHLPRGEAWQVRSM